MSCYNRCIGDDIFPTPCGTCEGKKPSVASANYVPDSVVWVPDAKNFVVEIVKLDGNEVVWTSEKTTEGKSLRLNNEIYVNINHGTHYTRMVRHLTLTQQVVRALYGEKEKTDGL